MVQVANSPQSVNVVSRAAAKAEARYLRLQKEQHEASVFKAYCAPADDQRAQREFEAAYEACKRQKARLYYLSNSEPIYAMIDGVKCVDFGCRPFRDGVKQQWIDEERRRLVPFFQAVIDDFERECFDACGPTLAQNDRAQARRDYLAHLDYLRDQCELTNAEHAAAVELFDKPRH